MPSKHGSFGKRFVHSLGLVFALASAVSCGSTPDIPSVYRAEMEFDRRPRMVIVVSFDGLRPDAIAPSRANHIQSLAEAGVSATKARTIVPSLTLPSHSSMLSGVSPEKHGIHWNGWDPSKGTIRVPTLFDEAKKAGLTTAMVVGKEKFKHLARPGTVDHFFYYEGFAEVIAESAISLIRDHRPNVLFVHFAHPDNVGHDEGWMTEDQFDAIHDADQGLGRIFRGLERLGLLASTAVIVTADHGGTGKGHGDAGEASTTIPWIAAGAGVPIGDGAGDRLIEKAVTTYDTAATAAELLRIPVPASWDGKPVFAADAPGE